MPPIAQWCVYHVSQCRHTIPPKNKYVLIACLEDINAWCFFINSEVNQFIKKRPALYPCMVPIKAAEHSFLRYDSWIDCSSIYDFARHELISHVGTLSDSCAKTVVARSQECKVLQRQFKDMIRQQAGVI